MNVQLIHSLLEVTELNRLCVYMYSIGMFRVNNLCTIKVLEVGTLVYTYLDRSEC